MLLTAPALGQVPVYTNADLGRPLAHRHTITPEEYRSLVAHQFVYVPPVDPWREWAGPQVTVLPYTPAPSLPLPPTYPLDPSWHNPRTGGWSHHLGYGYGYRYGYGGAGARFRQTEESRLGALRGGSDRSAPLPAATEAPMNPPVRTRGISAGVERRR